MSTLILSNGTSTNDTRLTRLQQFDERSRSYPITATLPPSAKPRSYTWACQPHIDQMTDGSCVGHGWAHELAAKPSVVKGLDHKFATSIYHEAQKIDEWPGGTYPGAYPQYEGTSVLAGAKVVKTLGYIKEYRWAFGLEDLIIAVGNKGPAVLGLDWYSDMFNVDENGFIAATGELSGGHCILCKGVNIKGEYFVLHNSWGPNWGVGGDAKISFDEMHYLLQSGGEACVPVVRAGTSWLDSLKSIFGF